METLRTPYPLTEEMQDEFYKTVICNPISNHRYWGIWSDEQFCGCAGITYIQWENRFGEISLILDPAFRGKGIGKQSVKMLLDKAFCELNLNMVIGECYDCNQAIDFWIKVIEDYNMYQTTLVKRKFYDGKYWDSLYFSISRDDYVQSIIH